MAGFSALKRSALYFFFPAEPKNRDDYTENHINNDDTYEWEVFIDRHKCRTSKPNNTNYTGGVWVLYEEDEFF
jgi:hypothetical protein